ncbi:MAG: DUF2147 domain-containing protein [Rhodoferax sp.]|jgi:uncharacterized protein (DUF2147 family)|nr:DUF2147 domain-containing protein [Rhodoferax sp.]
MIRTAIAIVVGLSSISAMAQMSPVGLWKTIDDKDGSVKSEIRVTQTDGVITGKIEKILDPKAKPDEKCVECTDDRKDQPTLGLEIIRGVRKAEGKDVWEGGTIVEPSTGKIYKVKMTPIEGGAKLEMRGFIGFSLLGRTQTWIRVN